MDLVKLESSIPIKAIPEQELNTIILTQFTVWVANLLSLTDETSSDRLETALPAIKEHCWSMGFSEIKKMFEMYADNKLSLKPIPNYFDRILLGKIVEAYKQQKPISKPKKQEKKITQEEIDFIMLEGCDRVFKNFKQTGEINEMVSHIYDYLDERCLVPKDAEYKKKIFEYAKAEARSYAREKSTVCYDSKKTLKAVIDKINQGQGGVKGIAKRLVLEDYFKKLINNNENIVDKL